MNHKNQDENTQPEALRLAELLTADEWPGHMTLVSYARECVAELRRLHSENERLAALVEAQRPAPSAAGARFDEHGFRDWVRRNMPDDTIIGNGALWADHLTLWAKIFSNTPMQPSQTAQADSQPGDKDLVAVPRDLIGAACSAIDKKCDGARTLAELRRYTVGDLSAAITSAPQADSVAAPAIGDELRDTLVAVSAAIAERDDRAAQKMIGEILAASPTPPAEQQAAPKAAPQALSDDVVKDAARYRWLIDQHWIQTEVDWRLISTDQDSTIKQLDAAIDAALAAQGGKE